MLRLVLALLDGVLRRARGNRTLAIPFDDAVPSGSLER
jgi:hypothetical protein